jgi:hypothetical protein
MVNCDRHFEKISSKVHLMVKNVRTHHEIEIKLACPRSNIDEMSESAHGHNRPNVSVCSTPDQNQIPDHSLRHNRPDACAYLGPVQPNACTFPPRANQTLVLPDPQPTNTCNVSRSQSRVFAARNNPRKHPMSPKFPIGTPIRECRIRERREYAIVKKISRKYRITMIISCNFAVLLL